LFVSLSVRVKIGGNRAELDAAGVDWVQIKRWAIECRVQREPHN